MKAKEEIREYWQQRAQENADSPQATTSDVYLRKLELSTIVETIKSLNVAEGATVLDVGCGDGYTTLDVAASLPGLRFLGVDYSDQMIDNAKRQLATRPDELQKRMTFKVGDATDLTSACGDEKFDVVTSDRCLINLTSLESQRKAIEQIAQHTKPGGHYVAIENFMEGQNNMNQMRASLDLPEIPVRWHNLFFTEPDFVAAAEPFFDEIEFKDFSSSYYFATRVVYSGMCKMRGETPDYEHEIHQLAVKLPWTGQFSPIRMVVLRRKDETK
jgi:ubiquinone/menaquinone biosynthesis C-methylase UbiE